MLSLTSHALSHISCADRLLPLPYAGKMYLVSEYSTHNMLVEYCSGPPGISTSIPQQRSADGSSDHDQSADDDGNNSINNNSDESANTNSTNSSTSVGNDAAERWQQWEQRFRRHVFQVLQALHYLHQRGVVHRNLRPECCLIDAKVSALHTRPHTVSVD
jgi:serine/threonine protein kinase